MKSVSIVVLAFILGFVAYIPLNERANYFVYALEAVPNNVCLAHMTATMIGDPDIAYERFSKDIAEENLSFFDSLAAHLAYTRYVRGCSFQNMNLFG